MVNQRVLSTESKVRGTLESLRPNIYIQFSKLISLHFSKELVEILIKDQIIYLLLIIL